jgi:hypothetical protein
MAESPLDFGSLMAEVQFVIAALDDFTGRDGYKAVAQAVSHGQSLYARLLECRKTMRTTAEESNALQSAAELLKVRLRFYGCAV